VPGAAATTLREQNNLAGIGFMAGAIFIFSVNDALGKWLAADYAPPQILLFRSVVAGVLLIPIIRRMGWRALLRVERPWLQLFRVVLAAVETAMFYWAVKRLPLADAMTYYLAGPIYVTLMAAVFLGEKVGWRRWLAVLVGFLGVIVALGPSAASFGGAALIAFAGSIIYSVYLVVTRVLRGTPDTVMAAWQIGAGLIFGIVGTPFVWVPLAHWYARRRCAHRHHWRQPVASAGAGLRRRAVPVHDDRVGSYLRLLRLRQRAEPADDNWRRDHRRRRSLHLLPRAAGGGAGRAGAAAGTVTKRTRLPMFSA